MRTLSIFIIVLAVAFTACNSVKRARTSLSVPSSFSPDYDEKDDVLCVSFNKKVKYKSFKFTITNNYGDVLWQTDDPANCWDGKHMTAGIEMGEGDYTYITEMVVKKDTIIKRGTVALIRNR